MTIELIEIAVHDRMAHPRLEGRVTGHVRAVLSETRQGHALLHDLSIPVWADIQAGASDADIDMALMLRAAGIVSRLKARLAQSS
jgi:hypothetical protein